MSFDLMILDIAAECCYSGSQGRTSEELSKGELAEASVEQFLAFSQLPVGKLDGAFACSRWK